VQRRRAQLAFSFAHVTIVTCYSRYSRFTNESVTRRGITMTPAGSATSRLPQGFRWPATIAVLALLQMPWPGWLIPGNGLPAQMIREFTFWAMAALLLVYVRNIERRPLSSIGLKAPRWSTLALGVAGAAAMIAGIAFIYLVVFPALGV